MTWPDEPRPRDREGIAVLDGTTAALTVNRGTSLADLGPLAPRMRALAAGGSGFETVPATPARRSGQSVLPIDQAKRAAFLAPLRPVGKPAAAGAGVSAGRVAVRPAAALVSLTSAAQPAPRRIGTAQAVTSAATTATPSTSCTY